MSGWRGWKDMDVSHQSLSGCEQSLGSLPDHHLPSICQFNIIADSCLKEIKKFNQCLTVWTVNHICGWLENKYIGEDAINLDLSRVVILTKRLICKCPLSSSLQWQTMTDYHTNYFSGMLLQISEHLILIYMEFQYFQMHKYLRILY